MIKKKNKIHFNIISNFIIFKIKILLPFLFFLFQYEVQADILKNEHASLVIPEPIEMEKSIKSNFKIHENEKKTRIQSKIEKSDSIYKNPIGEKTLVKKEFSLNPNNPHKGILISGKSPSVSAWEDGIVIAIDHLEGYDTIVIIQHKDSLLSIYGKLKEVFVTEGDALSKGTLLGTSSSVSGLYFQINQNGKPLNPLTFLK